MRRLGILIGQEKTIPIPNGLMNAAIEPLNTDFLETVNDILMARTSRQMLRRSYRGLLEPDRWQKTIEAAGH
uniref:Uncharacterized protein n=1 Tax=Caenorhabditis japonica TaxID=281687 RepID=A0A8R1I9I3_CAEJA